MTSKDVTAEFVDFSRQKLLEEYWPRMRACVESLTDKQVWWRPNEASNSIGNLLLHLNGNVTQWLVVSFTGSDDARNRQAEFAAQDRTPSSVLLEQLGATLRRVSEVLAQLKEHDLTATYRIQGYTVTGLHAVYHVVEHFGYHYGQIAYITKLVRGEDLGFYRELERTGRKES